MTEQDGGFIVYKKDAPQLVISAPSAKDIGRGVGNAKLSLSENGKLVLSVDNDWLHDLSRAYPVTVSYSINGYTYTSPTPIDTIPLFAAGAGDKYVIPSISYNDDDGTTTLSGITINIPAEIEISGDSLFCILDGESGELVGEPLIVESMSFPLDMGMIETEKMYIAVIVTGDAITPIDDPFLIFEYTAPDPLESGAVYSIPHAYNADASAFVEENGMLGDPYEWLLCANSTVFVRNPSEGGHKAIGAPSGEYLEELRAWLLGQGIFNFVEMGLEPINYNTGNFVYSAVDVRLPDYDGELPITRYYNSLDGKVGGTFGYGWEFAYDITLSRIKGGTYILSLGDGRTVWFRKNGSTFVAEDGFHYTWSKSPGGYTITDESSKTKYIFNYHGLLTAITDSKGKTISFTYDSNQKLASLTNAAGLCILFSCDSRGRIQNMTLPDGGVITYRYDNAFNLVSVTDQESRTTKYTYDSQHRLLTITDPEGTITVNNTYDSQNRVVKQIDANGNIATLSYSNGKTTVTDNNGNVTQVFYDGLGRTTKVINPDGSTEMKTWDNYNNMTSFTSADGNTTYYEYNADGLVTKETRADSAVKAYSYNTGNKITSFVDYNGNSTTFEYDNNGNIIKTNYPDNSHIVCTYNANNQLTSVTDQLGNTSTFEYTGAVCTAYTDALGNRTEYGYSTMGWLTAVKDANGNITRYLYNACGERYAEQRPDGSVYTYVYDDAGYVTAIVDELGYTSSFSYDSNGNMLKGIDPLGNTLTMSYDSNNNKLTSVDALGQTTSYAYDSMDRVTAVTDPNGGVTAYVYDAAGNIIAVTDPNANTANLTYNNILGVTSSVTQCHQLKPSDSEGT